ncbi:hypothetical protein HZU77_001645 [Neisseriaceae bacterium TC5R-5]|nr:hypothetical protein [Neisseriaceae bacterium TC5R-5]
MKKLTLMAILVGCMVTLSGPSQAGSWRKVSSNWVAGVEHCVWKNSNGATSKNWGLFGCPAPNWGW